MKPKLISTDYTAPQSYHKERQNLFRHTWLLAGHTSQLPLQTQLATTIAGNPILLWHTSTGIKAFANICRHRGAPLIWDGESECSKTVRCRYHGWQYAEDGTLIGNTDFGAPCDPLKLFELHVAIEGPWVFVAWEQPRKSPSEIYPTLFQRLQTVDHWTVQSSASHTLRCNWKVYVENYLEGYHIPYLHPSLTKEISMSTYRIVVNEREIEHKVATKESATSEGYWVYCWPNFAVNMYSNGMSIERVLPVSVNETRIEYWYLFAPNTSDEVIESSVNMSSTVTEEDIKVVEAIQSNLESGLVEAGPLSPKHEHGLAAFQEWVVELRG